MPLHYNELHDSRLGSDETVDFKLHVWADREDPLYDEAAIRTFARSVCPSIYDDLYKAEATIDEKLNEYNWKVSIRYEPNVTEFAVGQTSFRYVIGGGSQHIMLSRSTRSRTPLAGHIAKDFKGLINVDV